ncbi:DpnI domain-containing protein [Mesorhizobium sp. M1142]
MYCPNCGNSRLTQFPANLPVPIFTAISAMINTN